MTVLNETTILKLKIAALESAYDHINRRLKLIEFWTGFAFPDPHEESEIMAQRAHVEELRKAFEAENVTGEKND